MLHPIVAQTQPSAEQLPAITLRNSDIVVTAGAGAGKTRTLVARYLALLAEGVPLRSIVAITFTRKAAREMRNRVRAAIGQYLSTATLAAAERQLWDDLYSQLDAARINTIHGLCTEILRAHPAEAGIDPRFTTLEETESELLRAQAVEEALAWAADDATAVGLFTLWGERELQTLLADLLRRRSDVLTAFAALPDPVWPGWQAKLVPPLRAFIDDSAVTACFADLNMLQTDGTLARAVAQGDALAEPLRNLLQLWEQIQTARGREDWITISTCLRPLRDNMKQLGRKDAWHPANPKAIIKALQAQYDDRLAPLVGNGINLALDCDLAGAMHPLRDLFGRATDRYTQFKDERQSLDFDDLELGALALLRDYPAIRRRWQETVAAVLVDEFQDTNGRQRDLVHYLNGDGGKLFIVGDAKQSIYRFRGADVAVFRGERERLAAGGGVVHDLATSYRAHAALIAGLNALLRPILGASADPDRPWHEPFAPLLPHRREPAAELLPPYIEVHLTVGSKGDGALVRAAGVLTAQLIHLVSTTSLTYGDIAILCRATRSFTAYEDALDEAGIPYLTFAGRGFYERPEIRDLLNALQAVADPTDDLALVGLLRSPVLAVTDAELFQLLSRRDEAAAGTSLWEFLSRCPEAKIKRAVALVARLNRLSGRTPVADLLKAFLDATDYRAALRHAGHSRAARNVSKLLADAHASGKVAVGAFLEYVNSLRRGRAREGEAPATAENAVRIMTLHAAKGLEFPVVVLGDANSGGGSDANLIIDPVFGVIPRTAGNDGVMSLVYRMAQQREKDQDAAEADRLLYVAATRAREKLLVNGHASWRQNGTLGAMRGWLGSLASVLPLQQHPIPYDDSGGRVHVLELQVEASPVTVSIYEPAYQTVRLSEVTAAEPFTSSASWSPDLLEPVSPRVPGANGAAAKETEQPRRTWWVVPPAARPTAPAWLVGQVVHEALAGWRFPDSAFRTWAGGRARNHGLIDTQQLADAAAQAARLLNRLRQHPLYDRINRAERRWHELPYSHLLDGEIDHGIIDLLYHCDGVWTLVDFKTDWIADEETLRTLPVENGYDIQLGRYAAAVHQLLGQSPRVLLCLLNCSERLVPGGMQLLEWTKEGGEGRLVPVRW